MGADDLVFFFLMRYIKKIILKYSFISSFEFLQLFKLDLWQFHAYT